MTQLRKIRTSDGRLVDPFNITPEDIIPGVFIHAISCINRFTGHASHPYSVGQHTLNLINHLNRKEHQRAAFVHEWGETWFNDLASPVKHAIPGYADAEHAALKVAVEVMGVSPEDMAYIDQFDKRLYANERNAFFPVIGEHGRGDDLKPLVDFGQFDFKEKHFTQTRAALTTAFVVLFPEWLGSLQLSGGIVR